jgi:predicted dienelactone hydrolase
MRPWLIAVLVLVVPVAACGGEGGGGAEPVVPDLGFEAAGPYPVGHVTLRVTDAARTRDLAIELWYPAAESARAAAEVGEPAESYGTDAAQVAAYAELEAAAPAGCPNRRTHAVRDATPAPLPSAGPPSWPLVAFSHCHNCVRFSSFTIAERLASHGFVVVAPDHTDNTLFDYLDGTAVELSAAFLPVRAADVRFAIDVALAGDGLPAGLAGAIDPDRIGVLGHSFGAVTAGKVIEDDARVKAGMAIAAPMENAFIEGVTLADIEQPVMFMVAQEDNSITEVGNGFIRRNFDAAPGEAWKVEVADAGHWSFSDLVGMSDQFPAGCGAGQRGTDGRDFTYLAPETGRAIAAAYVAAFFAATLRGEPGAAAYLESGRPAGGVSADHRRTPAP